jgi:hypothetical protein
VGGVAGPAGVSGAAAGLRPSLPDGRLLDYDAHYRTHDVSAAQLWVDVRFLRELNRFPEVEQALIAFLKHHPKKAEPWMYLLLAIAYEIDGRDPAEARKAIAWAGYLARQQGDPYTLIQVADVMLLRGLDEVVVPRAGVEPIRAGALLDAAYDKAPHRAEPLWMSVLLAERSRDPERMGETAERLLALGWPGTDAQWRQELRRRVEAMARELESEGRGQEANRLLERLEAAWTRDLVVRLTWKGDAGLDLRVTEPLGAVATVTEPRTVFGGAVVMSGRGKRAESLYVCPRAFSGTYQVEVDVLYNAEEDPAREVVLEVIQHEGTAEEARQSYAIDLDKPKPITVALERGRRTRVLPFTAPTRIRVTPELAEETPREAGAVGTQRAAELLRAPDASTGVGAGTAPRR